MSKTPSQRADLVFKLMLVVLVVLWVALMPSPSHPAARLSTAGASASIRG